MFDAFILVFHFHSTRTFFSFVTSNCKGMFHSTVQIINIISILSLLIFLLKLCKSVSYHFTLALHVLLALTHLPCFWEIHRKIIEHLWGSLCVWEKNIQRLLVISNIALSISMGCLKSSLSWLGGIFIWIVSYVLLHTQMALTFHHDSDYWYVTTNMILFGWTVLIIANIDLIL